MFKYSLQFVLIPSGHKAILREHEIGSTERIIAVSDNRTAELALESLLRSVDVQIDNIGVLMRDGSVVDSGEESILESACAVAGIGSPY